MTLDQAKRQTMRSLLIRRERAVIYDTTVREYEESGWIREIGAVLSSHNYVYVLLRSIDYSRCFNIGVKVPAK